MRIAIVGGKLQGTEAAYLSLKAGYTPVLIDRNPGVPARTLVDEFHGCDVIKEWDRARKILGTVDAVLPATENRETLDALPVLLEGSGVPLMHDAAAYAVSCSKVRSDQFLRSTGIPTPRPWLEAGFPVILKPSSGSGSAGVLRADNQEELANGLALLKDMDDEVVVQEFVSGPSVSVEVIGRAGASRAALTTLLEFDHQYDCKRVLAPTGLPGSVEQLFQTMGEEIGRRLGLTGIMDVEAMVRDGIPTVIEIDARLPSQTPTAVLHCCGINMVELLVEVFVRGRLPAVSAVPGQAVIYEHFRVSGGELVFLGEHIMAGAEGLRLERGLWGADEVLTTFTGEPGGEWVATLINTGTDLEAARRKRSRVLARLAEECGVYLIKDPSPGNERGTAVATVIGTD